VAISLGDIADHEQDAGQVIALHDDLQSFAQLLEISKAGSRRQQAQHGSTLLPNVLCVAGAFFLGFTSLYTVLITNAGVWAVYGQGTYWLRGLKRPPRLGRSPAPGAVAAAEPIEAQVSVCATREAARRNGGARSKPISRSIAPPPHITITER